MAAAPTEQDERAWRRRMKREGLMCVMCMSEIPVLRCEVCRQALCAGCDAALHEGRHMEAHVRNAIDPPPVPPPSTTKKPSAKAKVTLVSLAASTFRNPAFCAA
jgi:hypothetical protein